MLLFILYLHKNNRNQLRKNLLDTFSHIQKPGFNQTLTVLCLYIKLLAIALSKALMFSF